MLLPAHPRVEPHTAAESAAECLSQVTQLPLNQAGMVTTPYIPPDPSQPPSYPPGPPSHSPRASAAHPGQPLRPLNNCRVPSPLSASSSALFNGLPLPVPTLPPPPFTPCQSHIPILCRADSSVSPQTEQDHFASLPQHLRSRLSFGHTLTQQQMPQANCTQETPDEAAKGCSSTATEKPTSHVASASAVDCLATAINNLADVSASEHSMQTLPCKVSHMTFHLKLDLVVCISVPETQYTSLFCIAESNGMVSAHMQVAHGSTELVHSASQLEDNADLHDKESHVSPQLESPSTKVSVALQLPGLYTVKCCCNSRAVCKKAPLVLCTMCTDVKMDMIAGALGFA